MFDQVTRKDEFAKRDLPADCANYIAELNGMIDRGGIDCMSHLDLIKIHGVWKPEGGLLPYFQPLLERIRRENLAIEISTAGWRKPVGEQYPHIDLIKCRAADSASPSPSPATPIPTPNSASITTASRRCWPNSASRKSPRTKSISAR